MTNQDIQERNVVMLLMAQDAGLEKTLAQFPDDVAIAMNTATQVREALSALENVPGQRQLPAGPMDVK